MKIFDTITSFIGLNKWYFIGGAVAVSFSVGAAIGWHELSLRIPDKLEAQKKADSKACSEAQAITKGQNDELVKAKDRIAGDLARYKRLHPDTCYFLAGDGKLQPGGGQYAGVHGISSDWLRDYAALCETYRSEVMVCTGQKE